MGRIDINVPIKTRHLDLYSGYCAEFKPEQGAAALAPRLKTRLHLPFA